MAQIEHVGDRAVVCDYKEYLKSYKLRRKRALLSYLTPPVLENLEGQKIIRFSNSGIALSWGQVLNELGYVVDIIDWDNKDFSPKRSYDLVVLHGGKNFKSIFNNLVGEPKIIHFLTGSYWKFNNAAEDARIRDFARRHSVTLERDRYIFDPEDVVNEMANGIIVLGDRSMRETYPNKYRQVITINNASYPDKHFDSIKKNYKSAKNKFLFFAGAGNVHKGLDLLIDAFKDLAQELYIVTVPDKKMLGVFIKELKLPNIHHVGEVGMRTEKFYKVMDECAYVILPSCSEGQAGSVVEAMNQGLIPVVSKETRLNTSGYGTTLKDNSIDTIKETVKRMAGLEPEQVESLARQTRKVAVAEHSPEKFRKNLRRAIKEILSN